MVPMRLGSFGYYFSVFILPPRTGCQEMWTAVGLDDAEIRQHQGRRFGRDGCTTIGVQKQLAGGHGMFGHGVGKQSLEQGCSFRMFDSPRNDAAAGCRG